ncbi:P-loop containing nucleoside triphosphate hydrolase protein [Pelagophyceae sp. CCMP2097]|nr:P-loop containing nucleoside triphosphate hydrolase protein [Pelagophyceae sp. CCMP2097]
MGTEAIRVIVRVRPAAAHEDADAVRVRGGGGGGDEIDVECSKDRAFSAAFDKVLGVDASQDDAFECIEAVVNSVAAGFNACVLAYGQTGSGKTHTMIGSAADLGVVPRAIQCLFDRLEAARGEGSFEVHASLLQIYGEKLQDLLSAGAHDDSTPLKVREANGPAAKRGAKALYVAGLSEYRCEAAAEAVALVQRGLALRTVRATNRNDESSRSHAVLQLRVETRGEGTRRAKLYLVDLAGSEKAAALSDDGRKGDGGRAFAEHVAINQSLSTLGNVISALAEGPKRRPHIPYRDSVLTRLLQDALGGNTRTAVIACVAPCSGSADETVSTLKFADRARRVMARVQPNREAMAGNEAALLRALRKAHDEIARLKLALEQALEDRRPAEEGAFVAFHNDGEDGAGGVDGAVDASAELRSLRAANSALRVENDLLRKMAVSGDKSPDKRRKPRAAPQRAAPPRPHSSHSAQSQRSSTPRRAAADRSLGRLLRDNDDDLDADFPTDFDELRGALRAIDELAAPLGGGAFGDGGAAAALRAECAAALAGGGGGAVVGLLEAEQVDVGAELLADRDNYERIRRERLELEAMLAAMDAGDDAAPAKDDAGTRPQGLETPEWPDGSGAREGSAAREAKRRRALRPPPSPAALPRRPKPAPESRPDLTVDTPEDFEEAPVLLGDGRDVGARVEVFSFRFNRAYAGGVVAYDARRRMHAVLYDTGEKQWHDLQADKRVTCLRAGLGRQPQRDDSPLPPPTPLSLSAFVKAPGRPRPGSNGRHRPPKTPQTPTLANAASSPYLRGP